MTDAARVAGPLLSQAVSVYALHARPEGAIRPEIFRDLVGEGGPLAWFSSICYLLDGSMASPPGGAIGFISHTAPMLLPQLSRRLEAAQVGRHGRVSGRVDWAATVKARLSEEWNSQLFICRESQRAFNRPENQLLKALLEAIQRSLDAVPSVVYAWNAWAGDRAPRRIGDQLVTLRHGMRVLGAHKSLRDLKSPKNISEVHLAAALSSRNRLYAVVAEVYAGYQQIVEVPDPARWRRAVNATLPAPYDSDLVRLLLS
jgi:hypothetical protein